MAKTIFEHRLIAALVLCLSGLTLLPFDLLSSRVFGWEQLAGAYNMIFTDDFEIGSYRRWQFEAPQNFRISEVSDAAAFDQVYAVDEGLISQTGDTVVLMAGFDGRGEPVFSVEARFADTDLEVRLGARTDAGDWRETDWQQVDKDSLLRVEWKRGHPIAQDGLLYLSLDGDLRLWLTDLDNDGSLLEMTALTKFGARTVLLPIASTN